jgi:ribonuclease H2 subunit A
VAKVVRDATMRHYTVAERGIVTDNDDNNNDDHNKNDGRRLWGCGYPSDPLCKTWVAHHVDPVFGFPEIVRFSWAPAKKLLVEHAHAVLFAADNDDDNTEEDEQYQLGQKRQQQQQMKAFLSTEPKRLPYFQRRGIRSIGL